MTMALKTFTQFLVDYFREEDFDTNEQGCIDYIDEMSELLKKDVHYGDCTKQNISCKICEFQNQLDAYYEYTKNFSKEPINTPE